VARTDLPCVCGTFDVGGSLVHGRMRDGQALDVRPCLGCGLARTYPPPVVAALKDGVYRSEVGFADQVRDYPKFRRYARAILDIAEPHLQRSGGRLLDVGCGIGALVSVASERGYEAIGVDINEGAVSYGREKLGLPLQVGDVDHLSGAGERFDVIVLSQVLEHLERPQDTIRRLVSMTTPGGSVVIESPNMAGLYPRLLGCWWYPYGPSQHLWHFTPRTIGVVAREADVELTWVGAKRCVDYRLPEPLARLSDLPGVLGMGDNLIAIFRSRA
jgi:2-polyprenyl-3-methyl-5-hydroxy-6-metoxy-1,4-benzoquinol methylase